MTTEERPAKQRKTVEKTHPIVEELRQMLVEHRKRLDLTQRDLAAMMGTTQSAVSDLENGQTIDPGLSMWIKWADAVGVNLSVVTVFYTPTRRVFHTKG